MLWVTTCSFWWYWNKFMIEMGLTLVFIPSYFRVYLLTFWLTMTMFPRLPRWELFMSHLVISITFPYHEFGGCDCVKRRNRFFKRNLYWVYFLRLFIFFSEEIPHKDIEKWCWISCSFLLFEMWREISNQIAIHH